MDIILEDALSNRVNKLVVVLSLKYKEPGKNIRTDRNILLTRIPVLS